MQEEELKQEEEAAKIAADIAKLSEPALELTSEIYFNLPRPIVRGGTRFSKQGIQRSPKMPYILGGLGIGLSVFQGIGGWHDFSSALTDKSMLPFQRTMQLLSGTYDMAASVGGIIWGISNIIDKTSLARVYLDGKEIAAARQN